MIFLNMIGKMNIQNTLFSWGKSLKYCNGNLHRPKIKISFYVKDLSRIIEPIISSCFKLVPLNLEHLRPGARLHIL